MEPHFKIFTKDGESFREMTFDEIANTLKDLSFNKYQKSALSTAIYPGRGTVMGLAYAGLGLGEAGEAQNKIKKVLRDDGGILTEEKRVAIAKEIGGNLWYCAAVAEEIGISLSDIAQMNLDELAGRVKRNTIHGSGDNR